jgi:chitin synthase
LIEYEAEAWETGSRHSDETGYESKAQSRSRSRAPGSRAESPASFHPSQSGGDYYRDGNPFKNGSITHSRPTGSVHSHQGLQPTLQQYALPQLPFMPFAGGPGSITGSDHGGQMPMPGLIPYQGTGSMYGMMPPMMPPMAPRNTIMTNTNIFHGDTAGSQAGFAPPVAPGMHEHTRPMSTFSMATSVNPFAGPNNDPNPSDDDLFNALRNYLSTQDLMTVTKK